MLPTPRHIATCTGSGAVFWTLIHQRQSGCGAAELSIRQSCLTLRLRRQDQSSQPSKAGA